MSAQNDPFSAGDDGGGGIEDTIISPIIKDPEGREVEPSYTETLRAKTENDNIVHRTLCGQSRVESVGEDEWNVTVEGIVTKSELQTLFAMRPADNKITIVGEARVHRDIEFDRFIYEQVDEEHKGEFAGSDGAVPIFKFQLQTQDDDN